jgi:endonuclease III
MWLVHACSPSTEEAEAGGSQSQVQSKLYSKFLSGQTTNKETSEQAKHLFWKTKTHNDFLLGEIKVAQQKHKQTFKYLNTVAP